MLDNFWQSFEKEAKKKKTHNVMLERLRKGLPIKVKGQSLHRIGATRLGRILRSMR